MPIKGTNFIELNTSQRDAIRPLAEDVGIRVIHGPPTTGKTKCLAVLMEAMALQGKRVLVCAESNKPVDNLLAKFAKTSAFEVSKMSATTLRLGDVKVENSKFENLSLAYKSSELNKNYDLKKCHHNSRKEYVLRNSKIVFATQESLFDQSVLDVYLKYKFDYAIIDDASSEIGIHTLMAIAVSKRIIMAGDHKISRPSLTHRSKPDLTESLFHTLMNRIEQYPSIRTRYYSMLQVQYAINDSIFQISNSLYYGNQISSDMTVSNILIKDLAKPSGSIIPNDKPLVWIDHVYGDGESKTGESHILMGIISDMIGIMKLPATYIGIIVEDIK